MLESLEGILRMNEIKIPILEDDTIWDLIHAFLLELHEKELIYISNGSKGISMSNAINNLLYKNNIIKESIYVPPPSSFYKNFLDKWIKNNNQL